MRGLEVVIFMVCIVLAIPLVAVLVPTYNSGNGLDIGASDLVSQSTAFNWSQIDKFKPEETNNPIIAVIEQAEYYFHFAIAAITWIGTLLFSAGWAAPGLIELFQINMVLSGVLLSVLGIILILAWVQITKGDDWSGRR
jgi:hypothetical protein